MKTTVDAAGLHEGGSTSFTLVVLSEIATCVDLTPANIFLAKYEIEGEGTPIS
jgi:hypothetical protein